MKKTLVIACIISLLLSLVSDTPVYAWNMPPDMPPAIEDTDYMFPSFANGERLLGKSEINDLPALGWNSWHAYGSSITEKSIMDTADAFERLGLKDVGYEYVVMDDGCYPTTRGEDGRLSNNAKFPSGFKALADYIHERELKFGMYNDVGTKTCAGQAGLYGNEDLDAQSFAEWDIDYIKVDFCYYPWDDATFSDASYVRYSTAPRVRSITLTGGGVNQTLNAVQDGIAYGKATKNTSGNYVDNIYVANTSYDPIHWGELQFDVTVDEAGTYDLEVEYAAGINNGRWLQVAVGPVESETRYFDELLNATANNNTYGSSPTIQIQLEKGENRIRLMNYRRQENALQSYAGFYDGLRKAGVADKVKLSVCEWGKTAPYAWAYKIGDSWRVANDITFSVGTSGKAQWSSGYTDSIMSQYNYAVVLDEYAGLTKGWNDPDMMCVGMIDSATNQRFTQKVDISHFTLWCMLNAPIMLGIDLTSVKEGDSVHQVITNEDALALHQDPLGIQAKRIYTSANSSPEQLITNQAGRIDVLAKPLANGDFALTFLNTGNDGISRTASVDTELILEKIGHKMNGRSYVENAEAYAVQDIWTKDLSFNYDGVFEVTVEPQETKTIRVSPYGKARVYLETTGQGTLSIQCSIAKGQNEAVKTNLILAEYDAEGRMKKMKKMPVFKSYSINQDESTGVSMFYDEFEEDILIRPGEKLKAFLWEEGTNKPLCEYAEYDHPATPESNLAPRSGSTVTTSEFVKMILKERYGEIAPTDEYWASGYLNMAFELGIISDLNYKDAELPISRQQAAQIGHEALLKIYNEEDEQDISAAESLEDLYSCRTCVMHIAQLYTKGIMSGKSDGLFHGDTNLTQTEAGTVAMKISDSSLRTQTATAVSSAEESGTDTISPKDVMNILESDKTALLIDVRTQEEYDTGHISGSICQPLDELEENLSGTFTVANKDTSIILYCQKGSRSLKAYNILKKAGYSKVYNLGGMENWPYEIQ